MEESETNVVSEVRKLVFSVRKIVSVVNRDDNGLFSQGVVHSVNSDILGLVDDASVKVVLRKDLIQSWRDDSVSLWVLEESSDEGLDELVLVHVDAGPSSSLEEY